MNGPLVCSSHSVTVLSGSRSVSPARDEITPTQEGCFQPHDAPGQGDGRRTDATSTAPKGSETRYPEMEMESRCSPRWSGEALYCAQTCSGSPAQLPLQTGFSPASNNSNNNNNKSSGIITLQSRQRGGRCRKVKEKKSTLRIAGGKNSQSRKVTDYYPIRRSSRKSQTELKCEEKKLIDELITKGIEEGMEVRHIEGKGRAVFATRCFQKGEYVVEYHGDLLQITDAKTREAEYAENPATGCYMYYFQYLGKTYCVDATRESERKGRLINHSKNGNCQTKLHDIAGVPHLVLVASRRVDKGEELLYDYGDRSKASIAAHPWLKH